MAVVSAVSAWLGLTWATAVALLGLLALVRRNLLRRRLRRLARADPDSGRDQQRAALSRLRVLLLRPCAGDESTLEQCLVSIRDARRSFSIEVAMAVGADDDDALPAMRRAEEQLGAAGIAAAIEVVPPTGPNRKASSLAGLTATRLGQHDAIVNADSNADLTGYDLDELVAPLVADIGIGAIWAPPAEQPVRDCRGNRASIAVLGGSLHAFGLLSGLDPQGLVGKLFAVRARALEQVGGFAPLVDYLGEDAELSRRLRASGLEVLPAATPVRAMSDRCPPRSVVDRHARWMAVIRAQRPALLATYPLFFCGTGFMLLLGLLGLWGAPAVAAGAIGIALLGRIAIALGAQFFSARRPGIGAALADSWIADRVLLRALVQAMSTTRVEWRGQWLRITPGGRLVADGETQPSA
ncbi:MAG: glycosyltransferase [Deltaproteobacteria bacterium]|nr:glycosyltransferase [Deltaproteobacteria bacterium]